MARVLSLFSRSRRNGYYITACRWYQIATAFGFLFFCHNVKSSTLRGDCGSVRVAARIRLRALGLVPPSGRHTSSSAMCVVCSPCSYPLVF